MAVVCPRPVTRALRGSVLVLALALPAGTGAGEIEFPVCGAAASSAAATSASNRAAAVTASDALAVLRAATGLGQCRVCVCDVDGSGTIRAADALRVLAVAVGQPLALACPGCICTIHGFAFGPYIDGQDPAHGVFVSAAQLRERMTIVSQQAEWVRGYGSSLGLEKSGSTAHALGLKAAIGAWLDADLSSNETEIANAIAAAVNGEADVVIVGNETLLRGDLATPALLAYIERVRAAVPASVGVTTAEPSEVWRGNSELIAAVDVIYVHLHPYWAGVSVVEAVSWVDASYRGVAADAGGKAVVIAETGWPSAGDVWGAAVPSAQNAATYFVSFVSWAEREEVEYFYFEATDESWKARVEGSVGPHWGVSDKDGKLKPAMSDVFACGRLAVR